jgi:phenylacetate-CoA ligase
MRKIRGVFFMPVMAEDVVRKFPEVDEFQIILRTVDELDTLVLQVEPRADYPGDMHADLGERVRLETKRQISLTPIVEIVATGSLPRYELKAKRFRDDRNVRGDLT